MKKVPALYQQLHTKEEIINFIDKFKASLIYDLKNYFALLEFNPQLVIQNTSFLYKQRFISFDNINDSMIYQLLEYCDLELIKLLHSDINLKKGLISFYSSIERDKNTSFVKSICENKLLIVQKILLIEANNEIILKFTNELINIINMIINKINLHDVNLIPKKIECYDFKKIKKIYPTISIKDAINELVSTEKCVLIFDIDNTFGHIERKELLSFVKNATLYVKSNINNKAIEIFNFYICPKIDQIIEKYKYNNDIIKNQDLLSTIFNKYNDLLGIEINFTRFLVYAMNKLHVSEINTSPLSEDIQKDFDLNKLFRW